MCLTLGKNRTFIFVFFTVNKHYLHLEKRLDPSHRYIALACTVNTTQQTSRGHCSDDLMADLDLALLRWVVGQAGGGDVVALLILENLVLLFHPRLPLLHFDL